MGKKIEEEVYRVGIQQKYYMDRMTRGSMKNIGDSWREIGKNRRERKRKRLTKKKRKKLKEEE